MDTSNIFKTNFYIFIGIVLVMTTFVTIHLLFFNLVPGPPPCLKGIYFSKISSVKTKESYN